MEALCLVPPVIGNQLAQLSYELFHAIMASSVAGDKKWEVARLTMNGVYNWDKYLPWGKMFWRFSNIIPSFRQTENPRTSRSPAQHFAVSPPFCNYDHSNRQIRYSHPTGETTPAIHDHTADVCVQHRRIRRGLEEENGLFGLHRLVSKFIPGSVLREGEGGALKPAHLFCTNSGYIGVISELDPSVSLDLTILQSNMNDQLISPGGTTLNS